MKKKSTLDKLTPFVVGTCMLTLVASCGSDDDDSSSSTTQSEQQEGIFTGVLTPLNSQISEGGSSAAASSAASAASAVTTAASAAATDVAAAASSAASAVSAAASSGGLASLMAIGGTVTVTHIADNFQVMVDTTEATATSHPQFIYTGSRCPTTADDSNGDGYVDVVEAMAASGQMLVPLDNDLKAQDAGGTFPSGANYSYDESASYAAMLADLQLPDANTNDSVVKLGAGEDLNVGTRVVIVHGVPSSTTLPPTVQGINSLSPQQTLPIACAVLTFASSSEAAASAASAAASAASAASTAATAASAAAASAASAATDASAAAASAASTAAAAASSAGATTGTTTGL